jgi:EthD domain
MEKLFYVLWRPEADASAWSDRLLSLPGVLATVGAERVRIGVPDVPVPEPDPYADMRKTAPAGFVSFWLNSARFRDGAEKAVRSVAPKVAGYSVMESTILPATLVAEGAREEGFLQVCGFAALPQLSRAEFWESWLGRHTAVAVETQRTTFYNQNVVVRALTEDAPAWDAIVEERFPAAALQSREVYFDAVGDPARLEANMARMAESCGRFIDFSRLALMNCGEYRFGGWRDAAHGWNPLHA